MNSISSKFEQIAVIQQGGRFLHILILTYLFIVSCTQHKIEITGSWIEPVPGQVNQVQGIKFEAGGKASSINMQTLRYETWEQQGEKLIVKGKSIGTGQTILFTDTLKIEKLASDTLVLRKGVLSKMYIRSDQVISKSVN